VLVWKLINSAAARYSGSRAAHRHVRQNTTETDFYADKQKQDAVIRRIEVIDETAVT
jgi:uncharacterized protein with HEPN domain